MVLSPNRGAGQATAGPLTRLGRRGGDGPAATVRAQQPVAVLFQEVPVLRIDIAERILRIDTPQFADHDRNLEVNGGIRILANRRT
jgi:hypothetical protein